jgi:hypothetical protein
MKHIADPIGSALQLCSVFESSIGSPIHFRTYDPVVYSPGVNCFVFSGQVSLQAAFRGYENPVRERKTEACSQRISCVLLCISLLLQREMQGYVLQLSSQLRLGM